MAKVQFVGKRDFLLHSNTYLKVVEETKQDLIVTYRNKPVFRISPMSSSPIQSLRGIIKHIEIKGDLTEPILEGLDKW